MDDITKRSIKAVMQIYKIAEVYLLIKGLGFTQKVTSYFTDYGILTMVYTQVPETKYS